MKCRNVKSNAPTVKANVPQLLGLCVKVKSPARRGENYSRQYSKGQCCKKLHRAVFEELDSDVKRALHYECQACLTRRILWTLTTNATYSSSLQRWRATVW